MIIVGIQLENENKTTLPKYRKSEIEKSGIGGEKRVILCVPLLFFSDVRLMGGGMHCRHIIWLGTSSEVVLKGTIARN